MPEVVVGCYESIRFYRNHDLDVVTVEWDIGLNWTVRLTSFIVVRRLSYQL